MLRHTVRNLAATGITVVWASALTVFGATGASASPAQPAAATQYQWANVAYQWCISEDGDTSVAGPSACNTNHSEYWDGTTTNPQHLVNLHSGLCLSVDGYLSTVGASPCNSNHAEYWIINTTTATTTIKNYHSGLCLQAISNGLFQTTCDAVSSAFQWYNLLGTHD
jgi:Ricin-type beta-trefoil lectin domain